MGYLDALVMVPSLLEGASPCQCCRCALAQAKSGAWRWRPGWVSSATSLAGLLVRTTVELAVALLPEWEFRRMLDPTSGYAERQVSAQYPG